jgi:hypothetical protein
VAKATNRTRDEKIKTAVVLSPLAVKRLGAACVAESLTQSELVEWLINTRLKDYSIGLPPLGQRIDVANGARRRSSSASVPTEESASPSGQVSTNAA